MHQNRATMVPCIKTTKQCLRPNQSCSANIHRFCLRRLFYNIALIVMQKRCLPILRHVYSIWRRRFLSGEAISTGSLSGRKVGIDVTAVTEVKFNGKSLFEVVFPSRTGIAPSACVTSLRSGWPHKFFAMGIPLCRATDLR